MAKGLTRDGAYGMTFQGSRNADYVTCDFTAVMFGCGGRLWDRATYTAEGHINNMGAVEALRFMRQMVADDKSVDPVSGGWGFDERLAAILQGKTAMALCWVPIAPAREAAILVETITFHGTTAAMLGLDPRQRMDRLPLAVPASLTGPRSPTRSSPTPAACASCSARSAPNRPRPPTA